MAQNNSKSKTASQPLPASRQKPQYPLDTLQSMINAVLLEIGKALRSANRKGVKIIGYDNERLQAFIPSAVEKFHLALDELESDIVRAKAVLARDLRDLRTKKYELEHPTLREAVDPSVPTEETTISEPSKEPERSPLAVLSSEKGSGDDKLNPDPFTEDADVPVKQEANPPGIFSMDTSNGNKILPDAVEKVEEFSKPYESQAPKDDKNTVHDASGTPVEAGQSTDAAVATPPLFPEVAATTKDHSMDFDSMFDTGPTHEDADINFDDFDFTVGGAASHDDFGAPGGDLDLSSFNNHHDDSDVLLQSHEGVGEDHLDMLDAAMDPTNNDAGADSQNLFGDDFGAVADMSTFDEILNGIGIGDGVDDGAGDDMMQHEFDDAFFGLDNTEDAE